MVRVPAQSSAPVQLYVELVVVPSCPVDVDTIRIVGVPRGVQQPAERAVEADPNLHVVVLALRLNICKLQ